MLEIQIDDKDSGFAELRNQINDLQSKTLTVGIIEKSPRKQFRLGTSQEFKPETAGLLLRQPIDAKSQDIKRKLIKIGREAITKGVDPDKKLQELGNDIKFDMQRQTDPPPQLRNAIIVTVENDS